MCVCVRVSMHNDKVVFILVFYLLFMIQLFP